MKVLVACEFSGVVRDAFTERGHDATSCDLLPSETPGKHYQGDVRDILHQDWDLMIAHPPCTYLSYAGAAHWNKKGRLKKRLEALYFFMALWEAPIEKICLENPRGCASPTIAKYSQEIQPYYFGDNARKTTWLWLKNLPLLCYDNSAAEPDPVYINKKGKKIHFVDACVGGRDRAKNRARFWPGISKAMAEQWGSLRTSEVA